MAKMGDYVNIKTGKLDANASSENGSYPFFTCAIEPLRIDTYSYDCECVLVAGNGDLNVKYYNGKFEAYQRTYIIESKNKNIICVPFLYRFLDQYIETLRKQSIGGVIKYIKLGNLTEASFPLYSIDKQKKIVKEIDKISAIISLRQKQLEKLDELVKSRFIEMFGEIGTDKFGWGLFKIGDLCIINPQKSDDTRLSSELDVSFVPMPAVSEHGDIDTSETRKYDEVKTGFTYFADDDVLFAKITPCMENGKGCVARHLCNGIGFGSTEFHVLRPTNKVNSVWVYAVTSFPKFREDAANNMTGSAGQRRVPAVFLEHYKITLPPIELQEQFAAFVEQTDKSKVAVQKSLEQLETLKKSLMQKYFG